jgi:hypothetical protein
VSAALCLGRASPAVGRATCQDQLQSSSQLQDWPTLTWSTWCCTCLISGIILHASNPPERGGGTRGEGVHLWPCLLGGPVLLLKVGLVSISSKAFSAAGPALTWSTSCPTCLIRCIILHASNPPRNILWDTPPHYLGFSAQRRSWLACTPGGGGVEGGSKTVALSLGWGSPAVVGPLQYLAAAKFPQLQDWPSPDLINIVSFISG